MKITRVSTDFFRWCLPFRLEGVGRAVRQQVVRYTRAYTHITRLQDSRPVKSLNGGSSPASSSRKSNPLRPVKNVGVVSSPMAAWRKNKAVKAARFAKAYDALDRISPIGVDDQGFAVHLSDTVSPEWWGEIDWDAIQEAEEAAYRHLEQHDDDCDKMDLDPVESEVEPMDWSPSQAPDLVNQHSLFPTGRRLSGVFPTHVQPVPETPVCDEMLVDAPALASFTRPSSPAGDNVFQHPIIDEPVSEVAPLPVENDIDMALAPALASVDKGVQMTHAPAPAPASTYTSPADAADSLVQSCFNDWDMPVPFPPTNNPVPLPSASPLPSSSPAGANIHQQTTVDEVVLKTVPLRAANGDPAATAPKEYVVIIEEARAFDVNQLKEPGTHFKQMMKASWQPDFNGNQLNSLANYPSHPWRFKLDPKSNFLSPIAGCPIPRLDTSRQKEVREHYMTLWKKYPEVWEALLGTMLQEGVTPDNLLLNHSDKAAVLDHQAWVIDHSRFDDIQFSQRQGLPLPPDRSREFHSAPHGRGDMVKRYYDEIHRLATQPVEVAYALRTLISVWLGRNDERYRIFRRIVRKAGWCRRGEPQLLRNFIVDVFRGPNAPLAELRNDVEFYVTTRYPRFFATTVMEEGISYDLRGY
jgi:hypothetical protein